MKGIFRRKTLWFVGVVLLILTVSLFCFLKPSIFPYTIERGDTSTTMFYSNVFVGEDVTQVSTTTAWQLLGSRNREIAATNYRVRVVDNIFGWAHGEVIVQVRGGCIDGTCVYLDGNQESSVSDGKFIFPTKYNLKDGIYVVWGTIVPKSY